MTTILPPDLARRQRAATMTVSERVAFVVRQHFRHGAPSGQPAELTDETHLTDDFPNADSLDLIELTIELEEEFAIELTDADMEGVLTFGALVGAVAWRALAAGAARSA